MSNEKLFQKVRLVLGRELTAEERKLIALADQILQEDKPRRPMTQTQRKAA